MDPVPRCDVTDGTSPPIAEAAGLPFLATSGDHLGMLHVHGAASTKEAFAEGRRASGVIGQDR